MTKLIHFDEEARRGMERGLEHEGVLPGELHLQRKAPRYYIKAKGYGANLQSRGLVFSYALAVSEENAGGGQIVTAPTCGSCGVVPAVLYHIYKSRQISETRILHALATAGLIGNVAKTLASISGAEAGCQAEVGVACAMAAAAANYCFGGSLASVEYAAEMGLEHHLGMTCDPICGLVQIPCIERNAHAAARALDANIYATFAEGIHHISYDKARQRRTGLKLIHYKHKGRLKTHIQIFRRPFMLQIPYYCRLCSNDTPAAQPVLGSLLSLTTPELNERVVRLENLYSVLNASCL